MPARRPSAIRASSWCARWRRRASRSLPSRGRARRSRRCRSAHCRPIGFASKDFCRRAAPPGASGLQSLAPEARTLVIYEAPHRVRDTLEDCAAVFGAERARHGGARNHQAARDDVPRLACASCWHAAEHRRRFRARRNRAADRRARRRRRTRRAAPTVRRRSSTGCSARCWPNCRSNKRRAWRRKSPGAATTRPTSARCSSKSNPPRINARPAYGARRSRPDSRCVRKHMEESPGSTGHGAR